MSMLARSPKKSFAQLPLHALDDCSFTSLQLRLLGKVIWHCRRSNKCWVRLERLADELGCHHTNVSTAISVLVRRGYLTRERSTKDARKFVYRLTDLGKSFALGQTIYESRLPLGKRSRRSNRQNCFDHQRVNGGGDASNRIYEIDRGIESINSAQQRALAQIERSLKEQEGLPTEELEKAKIYCWSIINTDRTGRTDSAWHRANRLLEECEHRLAEYTPAMESA